jgi:hypothetical protein
MSYRHWQDPGVSRFACPISDLPLRHRPPTERRYAAAVSFPAKIPLPMKSRALAGLALLGLALASAGDELVLQERRKIRAEKQPDAAKQTEAGNPAHISISDDGKIVATSQIPGQVTVWDAMSGQMLARRNDFFGDVRFLELSPDGRYVAYCSLQSAFVWDWIDQRIIWSRGREQYVQSIAIDSQRKRFHLLGSGDLEILSLEDGAEVGRINLRKEDVDSVYVIDSGEVLLLSKKTGILRADPETKQVTARIDGGYPRVQSYSEHQIAQRPDLAGQTKLEGEPFWAIDPVGKRLIIEMRGVKKPWIKLAATRDAALSPEIPLRENRWFRHWLGDSGKLITIGRESLELVDPVRPEERHALSIPLPGKRLYLDLDSDASGETIVVASSMGWLCYEGDPADPSSWRERVMADVPFSYPVLDFHPEGIRMIHGGHDGALWTTSLSGKVETKRQHIAGAPVIRAASFPDGTLIAATEDDYHLIREGKPPKDIAPIAENTGLRSCGDHVLLWSYDYENARINSQVNSRFGALTSTGKMGDSFPMPNNPLLHDRLPVIIHTTSVGNVAHYRVSEITAEGKCVLLHDRKDVYANYAYKPIVESRDSFLIVQSERSLARVNAATGTVTPLRDDMPISVSEGYLHPSGDRLFLVRHPGSVAPVIFPLAPDAPAIELTPMTGLWGDNVDWLGFTRNGKGAWLRKDDGSVGLWDCETGKAVAGFNAYEDGGAVVFLPDGRCAFSEQARGRAFLRKTGSTTLVAAESTPAVLEVLAPYLQLP